MDGFVSGLFDSWAVVDEELFFVTGVEYATEYDCTSSVNGVPVVHSSTISGECTFYHPHCKPSFQMEHDDGTLQPKPVDIDILVGDEYISLKECLITSAQTFEQYTRCLTVRVEWIAEEISTSIESKNLSEQLVY